MTIERNRMDPVARLLAALDDSPEVENFTINEIEALPIDVVKERLYTLGLDPDMPVALKEVLTRAPTPAQKIIRALQEPDFADEEIEHMDLKRVQAELHRRGVNYRSGIERVREQINADHKAKASVTPTPKQDAEPVKAATFVPLHNVRQKRLGANALIGVITASMAWTAVAAGVCLFLNEKNKSLQYEVAALRASVDTMDASVDTAKNTFALLGMPPQSYGMPESVLPDEPDAYWLFVPPSKDGYTDAAPNVPWHILALNVPINQKDVTQETSTLDSNIYAQNIPKLSNSIVAEATLAKILSNLTSESGYVKPLLNVDDARRNNPTVSHLTDAGGRGMPRSGFKPVQLSSLPSGTLVSHGTSADAVADNENVWNSPYTTALIKYALMPDKDIDWVTRFVWGKGLTSTGSKQEPEIVDHLNDSVTLVPQHKAGSPEAARPKNGPIPNDLDRDQALWNGVESSQRPEDFDVYLKLFPDGLFKDLARLRLSRLSQAATAPTAVTGPSPYVAAALKQNEEPWRSGQSNVALLVSPPNQTSDQSLNLGNGILPRPQEAKPADAQQPDGSRRPSFETAVKQIIAPSAFRVADDTINGDRPVNLDHIADQDQSFVMIRGNSQVMKQYLAEHGNILKCYAHSNKRFECYAQNQDLAELALRLGTARATPDAPAKYREAEQEARKAQRGIWRDGAYSQK